jgi:MFS family permease
MHSTASTERSTTYCWYVVVLLTLIYTVSFIDRQILALMIGPIRRDFGISDTQVSLLIGLAFALFYTFLGIPIARLADRHSRRLIIAVGVLVWCLTTAACGVSHNYGQLFLARVGVGVGEAALGPSALSMISDYFPQERRGRAISFYTMGISLGSALAMIVGGKLVANALQAPPVTMPVFGQLYGWQPIFFMVGLPGIVLALIMLTVAEPARREKFRFVAAHASSHGSQSVASDVPMLADQRAAASASQDADHPSLATVAHFIAQRWRLYGSHFLGMSVAATLSYGFFAWIPQTFVRTWGWNIAQVGFAYGCIVAVSGVASIFLVTGLANWLTARGSRDLYMRVALYCVVLAVIGAVFTPVAPHPYIALLMLFPATVGTMAATAAGLTGLMVVTPNQMRAQASALYYLVVNLIGLTAGPTGIALFTDHVFHNDAMLRYSVLCVACLAGAFAIGLLLYNLKQYRVAYEEAQSWLRAA